MRVSEYNLCFEVSGDGDDNIGSPNPTGTSALEGGHL